MMRLDVNGNITQLKAGTTLEQLLRSLDLAGRRLAVELNREVVPRSRYPLVQLQEGDRVEIVHAIGGG